MLKGVKKAKIKLAQFEEKAAEERKIILKQEMEKREQQWKNRVPVKSRYHKDYKEIEEEGNINVEEIKV